MRLLNRFAVLSAFLCLGLVIAQVRFAHANQDAPVRLSWDAFKEIKFEKYEEVSEDGAKFPHMKAIFSEDVEDLNGKVVLMDGYIYPYEIDDSPNTFFWTPYSIECPYCAGLPPSLLSAVTFKSPVKQTYKKITLTGRLELSHKNLWGIYYSLKDAIILLH